MTQLAMISGGQTGVDRAALDVAIANQLLYSGWCPRGGIAEDIDATGPVLLTKYNLRQTPSELAEQRTAWNVRDSNATLLIGSLGLSKGTLFTKLCADLIFQRPFHMVDLGAKDALSAASHWLKDLIEGLSMGQFWLNFAGPKESESPGIYKAAFSFIEKLVSPLSSETKSRTGPAA